MKLRITFCLKFFLLFCSLLLLLPPKIPAQRLNIRTYNVGHGLSQSQVNTIQQDREGYLWFGTGDGISKFDGHHFQIFTRQDGLAENFISSSLLDRDGNLWFGHENGEISRFDWQERTFKVIPLPSDSLLAKHSSILTIFQTADGSIWFGSYGSGIYKYSEGNFFIFDKSTGLLSNYVFEITQSSDGNLWLATPEGIAIISPLSGDSLITVDTLTVNNGLPTNSISTISVDKANNIWIGTWGKGLLFYPEKDYLQNNKHFQTYTSKDGLQDSLINTIYCDNKGNIWVGTVEGGVSKYITSPSKKRGFFRSITKRNGLSDNYVGVIYQDKEGNYWFGTNGGGVCQFRDESFELYSSNEGLIDDKVWCIEEDILGNYWIGSEKGLTKLIPADDPNQKLRFQAFEKLNGEKIGTVFDIVSDPRGYVWVGTSGNGLFRVDVKTNRAIHVDSRKGLPSDFITALNMDSLGNLWCGTLFEGIIKYQPATGKFENYTTKDGISGNKIISIFRDRNGTLWFGTDYNGIIKYENGKFHSYAVKSGDQITSAACFFEDNQNNLWIVTYEGTLVKYDRKKFQPITDLQAIQGETLYSITGNGENLLWLGTGRGILCVDLKDSSFTRYGNNEGFPIHETNQDAVLKDSRGNIWFGTIAGAVKYSPGTVQKNTVPPAIYITGLQTFWEKTSFPPEAKFPHNKNYLTFFFTGISFTVPEAISYQYKLEGLDHDWSPITKNDYVTYSNLPPGKYTFKVRAKNADGLWSVKPASYSFEILTPYWRTWWFISLFILTIAIGLVLTHRYRVRQIEKQNLKLETKVKIRTQQLLQEKEKLEEAYQALVESESKFRAFTETTSSAIIIFQHQKFKYVNPACEAITGYTLAEFEHLKFVDIVHPDDRDIITEEKFIQEADSETLSHYEFRIRTKDGDIRFIDLTARKILYEGDWAILGTAIDITERKEMENNLRRLSRAVETTPLAMVLTNLKGRIEYVNPGFLKHCRLESDTEVLGKPIFSFTNQAGQKVLRKEIIPNLLQGKDWHGEISISCINGVTFPAELICSVVVNPEGKPIYFLIHFQNIEDRKRNEQFLRDSLESYRGLFNNIPEAIYIQDKQGRFLDVNEGAVKMYGYDKDFFIGSTPAKLAAPGKVDMDETKRFLDAAFKGIPQKFEWWGKRKTGEIFPKEVILTKSKYFGKDVAIAIARDITERKNFEQLIQTEKERLAVTLRSIGDGVISTDIAGNIVLMNPAAEKLTGWKQSEAVQKKFSEIFQLLSLDKRKPLPNLVNEVMEAGDTIRLVQEALLISRDGSERIIAHNGAPIRDNENKIIGVVLVFRDITAKKQLEQERLKSQKLESVGLLAGGIAHDFNNILAVILGNISLAMIFSEGNQKALDRLAEAEKATIRAKDLTQQLLTFSKGGSPVKETASISELIQESVNFTLSGSTVRCSFDLPEDLWTVEVDTGQISQVIQNLILNAEQAMPEGGIIYVSAENVEIKKQSNVPLAPGKYIRICIKDQGVGIPPEYLDKIFDPYFTTKKQGNGLGLATSYSIIKKHNGHIYAESELGKGSTFYFYLPASSRKHPVKKSPAESITRGEGRILLMDDEELVREMAQQILLELGYEAVAVPDGKEAIQQYKQALNNGKPFDAVIMDLTIPGGMGGQEAIKELLKIDPNVVAIVASGYSSDPVMANYLAYGFSQCIRKPFTVKELSEILSSVLQTKTTAKSP